ncbi:MAG: hypothetical protein VXY18_01990 [Bacteroidota bacterium]|nr:hypothetical protein [Bacteroidota bacterium]|tara:strand:- start:1754 stop:2413 length:660 start_codon:yes stop_codon:yes gene_type:complete
MKKNFNKFFVLSILFFFPIVVYLFFASGVNNFAKLPILTIGISDVVDLPSLTGSKIELKNKITVLGFWGSDVTNKKVDGFNLNQKIYKRFHEFKDFQFVFVIDSSETKNINDFKKELVVGLGSDLSNWRFLIANKKQTSNLFRTLKTDLSLSDSMAISTVFIIDKLKNLRGRDDDEDIGTLFGYNSSSVAEINNKMVDDVKVILAEYRLALKKNNVFKD